MQNMQETIASLDQRITATLQDIDHDFVAAQKISVELMSLVKAYGSQSKSHAQAVQLWWRHFSPLFPPGLRPTRIQPASSFSADETADESLNLSAISGGAALDSSAALGSSFGGGSFFMATPQRGCAEGRPLVGSIGEDMSAVFSPGMGSAARSPAGVSLRESMDDASRASAVATTEAVGARRRSARVSAVPLSPARARSHVSAKELGADAGASAAKSSKGRRRLSSLPSVPAALLLPFTPPSAHGAAVGASPLNATFSDSLMGSFHLPPEPQTATVKRGGAARRARRGAAGPAAAAGGYGTDGGAGGMEAAGVAEALSPSYPAPRRNSKAGTRGAESPNLLSGGLGGGLGDDSFADSSFASAATPAPLRGYRRTAAAAAADAGHQGTASQYVDADADDSGIGGGMLASVGLKGHFPVPATARASTSASASASAHSAARHLRASTAAGALDTSLDSSFGSPLRQPDFSPTRTFALPALALARARATAAAAASGGDSRGQAQAQGQDESFLLDISAGAPIVSPPRGVSSRRRASASSKGPVHALDLNTGGSAAAARRSKRVPAAAARHTQPETDLDASFASSLGGIDTPVATHQSKRAKTAAAIIEIATAAATAAGNDTGIVPSTRTRTRTSTNSAAIATPPAPASRGRAGEGSSSSSSSSTRTKRKNASSKPVHDGDENEDTLDVSLSLSTRSSKRRAAAAAAAPTSATATRARARTSAGTGSKKGIAAADADDDDELDGDGLDTTAPLVMPTPPTRSRRTPRRG